MIPKIIHQIWLGSEKIKEECETYSRNIQRLNPDYTWNLWTEENSPWDLPKSTAIGRANWLRFRILQEYGGVYLDIDMEPIKSMEQMQFKENALNCDLYLSRPHLSLLASPIGHFQCEEVLKRLELNFENGWSALMSQYKKDQTEIETIKIDQYFTHHFHTHGRGKNVENFICRSASNGNSSV